MAQEGFVKRNEAQQAMKKQFKLGEITNMLNKAPYFVEYIRQQLMTMYGRNKVYKSGLKVYTTLNLEKQIIAQIAMKKNLHIADKRYGYRGPLGTMDISLPETVLQENLRDINNFKEGVLPKAGTIIKGLVKSVEREYLTVLIGQGEGIIELKDMNWAREPNVKVDGRWARINRVDKTLHPGDKIMVKVLGVHESGSVWSLSLEQEPDVESALISIEPDTGHIKAMIGGYNFSKSQFNRAIQAVRQPGSAFKPIVYAAALENGFTPSTIILDAPFVMDQGEGLKTWKPENYGKRFYGPSTLRTGIEKSRNLMTVRVAQQVGFNQISKITKNFGIYNDVPELLSVSLGAAETTLIQLTNAYCSFVNGGKKVTPIFIDRIQDRRGKTIFNADKGKCIGCEEISYLKDEIPFIQNDREQIISAETAYQITSMLEGVIKRGTGRKLKNLNLILAGKTGTTNKNMDAWFLGFTSKLVIGVYVGFDEPKTLGKYETGAKAALPVFKKFVEKVIKKKDALPFKVPKGINLVMVDVETGLQANDNTKKVIYESFKAEDNFIVGLENLSDKNRLGVYDSNNQGTVLRFY